MEKLSNSLQILQWNLRRLLKIPQKTVAPLIWRPSAITSSHHPSDFFCSTLSSDQNKKVKKILEELSIFSRLSTRFPSKITDADWKTMLELESRKARIDQAMFLFKKERLDADDAKKKRELKEMKKKEASTRTNGHSFVLPFASSISEEWCQMRGLVEAYRLENHPILAVDCQFLSRLSPRGRGLTALQLQYLMTENRKNSDPFRLYFINYNRNDPKVMDLEKSKLQGLHKSTNFCPIVTKNGLETSSETFQNGKEVIYLSPDASEELETVDNDKIYVIGGIVDRVAEPGIPKQASLEAAVSANVSARKLPIDRYVDFKSGSKFLTLLAVAEILRQVNLHGDWKKAMDVAIPVRNKRGVDEKNPNARAAHARIHEFNQQILRRIDQKLGKEQR